VINLFSARIRNNLPDSARSQICASFQGLSGSGLDASSIQISVKSQSGDTAVVSAAIGGSESSFNTVREAEGWRIDSGAGVGG
jgi:hypothetical protein